MNLFVICCLLIVSSSYGSPKQRRSMVGGWSKVENGDKGVHLIASFASDVISDRSNSFYSKKLIHVHEAKRQLVAGWKYNITFDLGTTICRKNEVNDENSAQCTVSPTHKIERCSATVYERPWLNEKQLLSHECRDYLDYWRILQRATGGRGPVESREEQQEER
ncbi:Cystatin-1 [Halotydeus destructor]|nr:Cystatin-1 [Halotydeus destructor]